MPCEELDRCNELIEKYWKSKEYDKLFASYLSLAEQGSPLAECQIGYFYTEGLGVARDMGQAIRWYREAAHQGHELTLRKCGELNIPL